MTTENMNNYKLLPPSYSEPILKKSNKLSLNDDKLNILKKKFIKISKLKAYMINSQDDMVIKYLNKVDYSKDDELITKLFKLKESGMIIKKSLIL